MTTKKYYWLKLKENFFRDKRIKKLRRIAGGDTFTIIYLKMQLLSLKDEGKLLFEGVEENFAEEIALEIDEDVDNVKMTMAYLSKNGLIEEVQPDQYILPEAIKNIGKEGSSAERVRRHRAKKQASLPTPDKPDFLPAPENEVLHCNAPVTNCNTEIEIETDIEKEKEIDIDKEIKLTDKQREKIDLVKDLFEGWKITDYQIYHLSFLLMNRLVSEHIYETANQREIRLYDEMHKMTIQARANNVRNIYGWMKVVIEKADL